MRDTDPHILVVDSDPGIRLHLSRSLTAAGSTVTVAADGGAVLRTVVQAPPSLLLLDLGDEELPVEVDDATSQAKLENGVLTLTLIKKQKAASQLQVSCGDGGPPGGGPVRPRACSRDRRDCAGVRQASGRGAAEAVCPRHTTRPQRRPLACLTPARRVIPGSGRPPRCKCSP